MSPPTVIGLAGPAGVGKDSFALALSEIIGYRVVHWADEIKETARRWFGWTDAHLHGELKEVDDPKWGFSPRQFFLLCGTEFARNMLSQDIWVRIAVERNGTEGLIYADTRFENEAQWIRSVGGQVVHIRRAEYTPTITLDHASEAGLLKSGGDWLTEHCVDLTHLREQAQYYAGCRCHTLLSVSAQDSFARRSEE